MVSGAAGDELGGAESESGGFGGLHASKTADRQIMLVEIIVDLGSLEIGYSPTPGQIEKLRETQGLG